MRLRGQLDESSVRGALDTLVSRHEVLRTVFVAVDGEPLQQIAAGGRFALRAFDLRGCEQAEREAQTLRHKREEAHERFDLQRGPLIRGRLLRLEDEEHVLLVTIHHIVADGWSLGVFFKEFAQLYRALREGRDAALEPLPIQYADYAQWQREWLQGESLERQLSYWRTQLQGTAEQLELPTDHSRPAEQSYRGGNIKVTLDAELSGRVKGFAQRHEMTLFMVLYAAWTILLARLSGQEEVAIGTPIANRQRPELERLIGFFVNTLVLRVGVSDDSSVSDFLRRVKEATLGAYDHQDVPFERVVEALQPQRSLSRNPLFQVMFALQNAPQGELRLPGLVVTLEDAGYESAMFDLLISLQERGDQIAGSVIYAADIFDRETLVRWLSYFQVVLRELIERPQALIQELSIVPVEERRRVVEEFNATRVPLAAEQTIVELFEEQVRRTPDAVAVRHEGQWLTYAQLSDRADQLARWLQDEGVRADQVVGICLERSVEMIVGILGILKAGGAYMPLDPSYPAERLQYMVKDAAPAVVLSQASLLGALPPSSARLIALDEQLKQLAQHPAEDLHVREAGLTGQSLVYVIYTSGSTGRPKGTAMTHRAMVNLIEWHRGRFSEGARVLQFAALSFDVAFQEIFSTLCTGSTLVLVDEWTRRDARALLEYLKAHEIERLFVPPLMLQSLAECVRSGGEAPVQLQDVVAAGEQLRVSPEVVELFGQLSGCRLHNHYGPTETHVVTALTLSGDPTQWPALPSIGRPIANTQLYVLDGRGEPTALGVPGEIYIGGVGLARGYLHRAELTAERFVEDALGGESGARLYRTGDLGRWRADGTLEYLGRNDDQVKIRGYRIELGEIEAQLARHDEVKEVAVLVREDAPGEKRLVAYVTARGEVAPDAESLRAHLKAALPEHMIPGAFVMLESLPVTPSGKLNRRALPSPEPSAYLSQEYAPPQGATEEALARIWQELLHLDRVGRHDNFFELGGHSLYAMRLVSKLTEQFNVRVSVVAIFQHPTLEAIAHLVSCLRPFTENEAVEAGVPMQEGAL
jgi:amino acid adenylation domain-containing protein